MNKILKPCLFLISILNIACSSSDEVEAQNEKVNYPVSKMIKYIPFPTQGMRWIINEEYSDEFNENELDNTKWLDYNPNWIGRQPGLFMPSQVEVKDGMLQLKGGKMNDEEQKDHPGFNIKCAAVVSKRQKAHYGYYECKFKASKTTLSTTFWLNTRGSEGNFNTHGYSDDEYNQPSTIANGKYSQELDIQECIGRVAAANTKEFAAGMNSNLHFKLTPSGGTKYNIDPSQIRLSRTDDHKSSDDFNIYGCWWKNKSSATFYFNNQSSIDVDFISKDKSTHFYFPNPMAINLVSETYDWIDTPTDEELADPTKNTSYYDWVRSYVLVPFDEVGQQDLSYIFQDHIYFWKKPNSLSKDNNGNLNISLSYTSGKTRIIDIIIYDANTNEKVVSKSYDAYSGYANGIYKMSASQLKVGGKYVMVSYIRSISDSNILNAFEGDSYEFIYK